MAADTAGRVTGFVLRVSSCFCLACVENDWRAACWKLSWFPSVVLTRIMRGEGDCDAMILAAAQSVFWPTRVFGICFWCLFVLMRFTCRNRGKSHMSWF